MKNAIALINLHNNEDIGLLSENRTVGSTTLLCRYAFIDFALSNLSHSKIDEVGILVKNHVRSVVKHLNRNSVYSRNTKTGYQYFFINEKGLLNPAINTDVNNILENDFIFYDSDCEYVIITPVNYIMKMNYRDLLKEHIACNEVASAIVAHVDDLADESLKNGYLCEIGIDQSLKKAKKISNEKGSGYVGLETYIFNKSFLKELLDESKEISQMYNINDLVIYASRHIHKINTIEFKGKFRRIASLKDYYNFSMEVLNNEELFNDLFDENWPIYTVTHNSRPVIYGEKSKNINSLIANGCTINGTVKNSVLSRNVRIEEGATVENSIIFTNTVIEKGVHIKNAVVDKHAHLRNKKQISGKEDDPIYIGQGAVI